MQSQGDRVVMELEEISPESCQEEETIPISDWCMDIHASRSKQLRFEALANLKVQHWTKKTFQIVQLHLPKNTEGPKQTNQNQPGTNEETSRN